METTRCDAWKSQYATKVHHRDNSSSSSPSSLATSVATTTLRPDVPMDVAGLALVPAPKSGSNLLGTVDWAWTPSLPELALLPGVTKAETGLTGAGPE